MRTLVILFFTTLSLFAYDATNGTVLLLEFNASQSISLSKNGITIPLLKHPNDVQKKIAFIAIPYRQDQPIELLYTTTQGSQKLSLHVKQGDYKKEILSVEPSKVSPPKEALAQIKKEAQEAAKIYQTFTPKRYWTTPFAIPLQSTITSDYGNARIFNDTLQSYHSGTDFRASSGTPIVAANDGIVVLAKTRYYAGGSIVIDHGEGLYSVYYHLSSLSLHVGDNVKQGDIVGLSGSTGRVTGPHLHFGFMVQGIPIDPLDFIDKINTLFE
ncbi:MAG: M23 family metallopeptidase [Sulfurospirillaceae bacterium]|nr:M23 family metallopeptidase [Sulfurospirillaceae bacterium]MDD2826094.1 M23 family metallopeptidase [Sulfurospirillaceae bacterium]